MGKHTILSGPAPFDLEEIVWDDAETDNGWESTAKPDFPTYAVCLSLGFVIKETGKHIILASTISRNEDEKDNVSNNRIQIPKGMILRRRVIQPKGI